MNTCTLYHSIADFPRVSRKIGTFDKITTHLAYNSMYLPYTLMHIICNELYTFLHAARIDISDKNSYNKSNYFIKGGRL